MEIREICPIRVLSSYTASSYRELLAVTQALEHHCPHPDGVQLCLRQLLQPDPTLVTLDLSDHPKLVAVEQQPLRLEHYDHLLKGGQDGSQLAA